MGGQAYNAKVFDRLLNPIGAVMSEQSWDLGTIKAGENIKLQYTVKYKLDTPSGFYINTASVEAYRKPNDPKTRIIIADAVHTLEVKGVGLSIGNVGVSTFMPTGNGQSSAIIAWETSKPSDGQVFVSTQGLVSPFNPLAFNYGYQRASYRAFGPSTLHYIIIPSLVNGTTYTYRLRSSNPSHVAFGGDYTFTVPGVPATAVAKPWYYKATPMVAGVSIVNKVAPSQAALPTPVAKPTVAPAAPGSFVQQVKDKVFKFFY
jgi:hypothetical protein